MFVNDVIWLDTIFSMTAFNFGGIYKESLKI